MKLLWIVMGGLGSDPKAPRQTRTLKRKEQEVARMMQNRRPHAEQLKRVKGENEEN